MEEDEIAIVGAGCRFPGAENLDEFWKVLINGENHVREIPESRWKNSAFYNEDPNVPGKSYATKAGLLENHDKFDHRLFGISEVEATRMDPQQRYVLECVHMAMEDGGFTRKEISGSNTGVIIGCMNDDYKGIANADLQEVGGYNATGTSFSVISARVSYVYNLHGTCLTLDTACSSALVAIHLASQAIRTGDCDMVICGGVNSIMSPDIYIPLCKARMMSASGQCQSFCDTADGYVRGEGCGIVILKGYKMARRDGNKIWATLKTGSNQDGCTTKPMTAPSGKQQLKLLKRVYEKYKFDPADIQYIEAHGTGTPIGDPTEINALGEFFSSFRARSDVLLVGSVKSNIGHTESAAGIAGLLKVLLMMKHGKYVPSLHVQPDKSNLNKKMKLNEHGMDISTSVDEWAFNKSNERHACLNSFGFGGSNTHVIISMHQKFVNRTSISEDEPLPVCVSGVDNESLKQNLLQLHDDLDQADDTLQSLSWTSFQRRDIFPLRTIIFGKNKLELQRRCKIKADQVGIIQTKRRPNIVFVYCGVGTTYTGMCKELMSTLEVFRHKMLEMDKFLIPLIGWSIAEKFMTESNYDDPFLNHVAIFCVQVALTEVWKSFGIVPDRIIGQSVGEVAAAYAARYLSLQEAINVIYHRSIILSQRSEGSMVVVGNIETTHVEKMCSKHGNNVCIAVYSSPNACTISGSKCDLETITNSLKNDATYKDLFVRELRVGCAYHSPFMDGCLQEVRDKIDQSLSRIVWMQQSTSNFVPLLSTVTGKFVSPEALRTGDYWAENIRQPVQFMQSIQEAFDDDGYNIYLEIGPRPVLRAHISSLFENTEQVNTLPSMMTNKELQTFYESLTKVFEIGIDINCEGFCQTKPHEITRIPRYAFHKSSNIFIPNKAKIYHSGSSPSFDGHLFVQTSKIGKETTFNIFIDEDSTPFVFDHFLSDNTIIPGATYIEAGLHIGLKLLQVPVNRLAIGINFVKTFSPLKGRQTQLQINVNPCGINDDISFFIKDNEVVLATGSAKERQKNYNIDQDIDYLKALCYKPKSKKQCYDALEELNFRYGENLSTIQQAWLSESGKACLAEIRIPTILNKEVLKTHFHPSAIDSMLQMFGITVAETFSKGIFALPIGVESVVMNRALENHMFCYAEEVLKTKESIYYNAILLTANGIVIAEIEKFFVKLIPKDGKMENKSSSFELGWLEKEVPPVDEMQIKRILLVSNKKESRWIPDLKRSIDVIQKEIDDPMILNEEHIGGTHIIYHVSGQHVDTKENDYIVDDVVKRFLQVQKMIIANNHLKDSPPITIVTENTNACPGREIIGFTGSELWGMIRSALHEGFFGKLRLVDIDPNKIDISVLLSVISLNNQTVFEHAISGSRVFQSHLISYNIFREQKRTISVKPTDILSVHSSTSNCVSNPYLFVSDILESDCRFVSVNLDSFSIHNKSVYITGVGSSGKNDGILLNEKNDQIIILEGRGKLHSEDTDVVFLYPVKASTYVNIPTKCTFLLKDFPSYKSGILLLINIIVRISSAIGNRKGVAVLLQNQDEDIGQISLKRVLQKKRCNVQFHTIKNIQKCHTMFEEDTLLFATKSSIENWKQVIDCFPRLRKVITISHLMPEQLSLWIKHNFLDITIEVISTADIMSSIKIVEAMPMIRNCIKELPLDCQVSDRNNFILNLPLQQFELKRGIENNSLKCYVTTNRVFRSDASYVIVGGLSGLGWEILQHMAATGAKFLITMSRRTPIDVMHRKINHVENQYECHIFHQQVDICNLESVKHAFMKIRKKLPTRPIRGIFHGAGITSDSILQNINEEMVSKVMKPKVQGVWNLHLASLHFELDYFVIHSSIASVLGNPGQCNYSAANSFLDSFALYRRSLRLPAQSINWGALEVGIAAHSDKLISILNEKGFNLLTKDEIRNCFIQTLLTNATNVAFANMDWEKLFTTPSFAMQSVKFNAFQKIKARSNVIGKRFSIDLEEFKAVNGAQTDEKIKAILKMIVKSVLVTDENSIHDDTRFIDIGIDSMVAMTLLNAIYDTFGVREQIITLLSEKTTIANLSKRILQNLNKTALENTKENNGDQSQFLHVFESKELTFMQKDMLDKCRGEMYSPYRLTVLEIEIFDRVFPLHLWRKVFINALKLNPAILRKYSFRENGKIAVETTPGDPQVNVMRLSMKEFKKTQKYDVRRDIKLTIDGCLPIALQIAQSLKKSCIRLIVHKSAIDLRGLTILCRDIGRCLECAMNKKEFPGIGHHVDVPEAVKKYILPRMSELKEYWKNYLNHDLRPITFSRELKEIDSRFCCNEDVFISKDFALKIKDYVANLQISLYEFMISLYQLYLYLGSGSRMVTVSTAADMRYHVPELKNVLTRCVNYIPVVAEINEKETIEEFITHNCTTISMTTKNGAYPSSLILENIQSKEMKENIDRHVLTMNDLTGLIQESQGRDAFKLQRILHEQTNRETCVYVQYNLKQDWIKLQIGYNSHVCGNIGHAFANTLLSLARMALEQSKMSVEEIKEQLLCEINDKQSKQKRAQPNGYSRPSYISMKGKTDAAKYVFWSGVRGKQEPLTGKNDNQASSSNANGQNIKLHKTGTKDIEAGASVEIKDVFLSGMFRKNTAHGWDHNVNVRLITDVDDRVLLEWGKDRRIRSRTSKVLDLNKVQKITTTRISGLECMEFISEGENLVFKTPNSTQAEMWMYQIERLLKQNRVF